ncbi:MarR family winged helix-turn-helix transcriptional regulator [Streptomyces sp. NPDC002932]|uniref:MarR family winged helix-turn-helix transcriptional regulator n=1 Tax=Streptomyces sp. NPDC002932 TaxID=3364672 RepID=UPI0036971824
MDYSHDDEGLARQPIGYWSWAAHTATVGHLRSARGPVVKLPSAALRATTAVRRQALAEHGLTQPRWWVLNQLADADDSGRPRAEVVDLLRGYLDVGDGMEPEVDALIDQGLITQDAGTRLRLTREGRELRARAHTRVSRASAEIHDGIPTEEFVRTMKVLQRMIHNVGGKAWHH